jgi:hypothetical protein
VRVHDAGHNPSLNLLWALQGAINRVLWTMVPPKQREALRTQVAALPNSQPQKALKRIRKSK